MVVKRRIYLVAHVDYFGGRLLPKEGNKNHYSVGLTTMTTRTQWVCAVWRVARPRRRRRRGTPSAVPLSTTETDGGVDNDGSDCGGSGSSGVPPVDNRVRFLRSEPLDCQSYRSSHAHTVSVFLTCSRITAPPPPTSPPSPSPLQLCVAYTSVPSVCVAPSIPIATEQLYNKQQE